MEIEAMRLIEPVGGELQPVSRPPIRPMEPQKRDRILSRLFPSRATKETS